MSVRLYDPSTKTVVPMPDEKVEGALAAGFKQLSPEQAAEFETTEAPDTSLGAKATALVGEGLNTASFGGSDWLIGQLGTEEERRYHQKVRRDNPITTIVGGLGGAIIDPFSAGKAVAGIGERVAGRLIGPSEGAIAQIARSGVASGTEGVAGGIGTGVSRISLGDDDAGLESTIAQLSSDAIFGGGVSGIAGSLGKAADVGLRKARARLDVVREGMAGGANVADDLVGKSETELIESAKTERERLVADQLTRRATVVDDAAAIRQQIREVNPFLVVEGSDIATTTKAIEKALKRPEALAANPGALGGILEEQGTALKKAIASRDKTFARLDELNAKIAQDVTGQIAQLAPDAPSVQLSGDAMRRFGHFTDKKISRKVKAIDVPRDDAARFVEALNNGQVRTSEQRALDGLDGLLESNQALRAKIRETTLPEGKLASERLTQIEAAQAAAKSAASRPRSFVEDIAQNSIFGTAASLLGGVPVVGTLIGAKLARGATDLVFGRLGNATAEASKRAAKAIDSFLSVAPKVAKPVPVLASRALAQVRYAELTPKEREASTAAAVRRELPALFRQRAAEIRSQTEYGPDGKAQMKPAARQALAARLAPIAVHEPLTADKLEAMAARRMEFLANKLPRRPEIGGMQLGPDNWQPSELEMRQFARYAAAVEDPTGIIERLATGAVNPEDAEVMRTVYPEMFAKVKRQIIEKLPQLQKQLPYSKRIALAIFSGVPVDPAMNPQVLAVLQGQFAEEPGSEGGTQMPQAAPQFGSVSKPNATPAQERAG